MSEYEPKWNIETPEDEAAYQSWLAAYEGDFSGESQKVYALTYTYDDYPSPCGELEVLQPVAFVEGYGVWQGLATDLAQDVDDPDLNKFMYLSGDSPETYHELILELPGITFKPDRITVRVLAESYDSGSSAGNLSVIGLWDKNEEVNFSLLDVQEDVNMLAADPSLFNGVGFEVGVGVDPTIYTWHLMDHPEWDGGDLSKLYLHIRGIVNGISEASQLRVYAVEVTCETFVCADCPEPMTFIGTGLEEDVLREVSISASGDDGYYYPGDLPIGVDGFDSDSDELRFGIDQGNAFAYTELTTFLTFRNVNVPQGARVNTASIEFVTGSDGGSSESNDISIFISGHCSGDSTPPTSIAEAVAMERHQTRISWQVTNVTPWSDQSVQTTPDIAELINAIIDHPDWVAGNDLTIFFENDGSAWYRPIRSYDSTEHDPPKLTVWYSPDYRISADITAMATATADMGSHAVSITGTATVTATAVRVHNAFASITATADVNLQDSVITKYAEASVNAIGSVSLADPVSSFSLQGSCTLSAVLTSESAALYDAAASAISTASTSGSGTVTFLAETTNSVSATASGEGLLVASASGSVTGVASMSGEAEVDASIHEVSADIAASASVSGVADLLAVASESLTATVSVSSTETVVRWVSGSLFVSAEVGSASIDYYSPYWSFASSGFSEGGSFFEIASLMTEYSVENMTFSLEFSWSVVSPLDIGLTFSWATGVTPLRWYRVVGRCGSPNSDEGGGCTVIPFEGTDENCTGTSANVSFVRNVLATSVGDLCERLRELNWEWPIVSIERYSQPFGIPVTDDCNRLEVVPHCVVPQCMTFCVDEDVRISFEATLTIVDYFYSAVGSGGITLFGSADAELPASIEGDGEILTSGSAIASCSYWAWTGSGSILTDGEADVTSQSWTHEGSGSIVTSGSGSASVSFASYEGSGSIQTSGGSNVVLRLSHTPLLTSSSFTIYGAAEFSRWYYRGSGEILTSGAATVRRPSYVDSGSGGIVFGGEARWVSPDNHYVGDGSVAFGGSAEASSSVSRFEAIGDGSITFSGDGDYRSSEDGEFWWTGDGTISMSGDAVSYVGVYRYLPSGSILLSGNGSASSDWMGIVDVPFQAAAELVLEEIEFAEDDADELVARATTISTSCGECEEMPLQLILTHSLNRCSVLREFLSRNGLEMPSYSSMRYGRLNESWQSNLHFEGHSSDGGTRERWRILTEWACVDELGGSELSGNFWKFSMLIVRKNLTTNVDFDTRLIAAFSPDGVCDDGDSFRFGFDVNVRRKTIVNDRGTLVDVRLLNDNIGLFRSPDWTKSPSMRFVVAEERATEEVQRMNIRSIIPSDPLLIQG